MKREVGQVITEHGVAPQPMLKPEGAMQQRIILLRGPHLEPDAPKPMQRLEGGTRNMTVVIPQKPAIQRRPVGDQHDAKTEDREASVPDSRRHRRIIPPAPESPSANVNNLLRSVSKSMVNCF